MQSDLKAVLGRYPVAARPSSEPMALGGAGGLSGSRLWRYQAELGLVAARAWPTDGPALPVLEQIHDWLVAASALEFVPVPLRCSDGRTIVARGEHLWEVVPWKPGKPAIDRPPTADQVREGFAALAEFHRALEFQQSVGVSPGLVVRLRELEWWQGTGFGQVATFVASRPHDRNAPLALRWAELARSVAPRVKEVMVSMKDVQVRRQPCLRDARPEHLLFEGDRVVGLVDFGAMGEETVSSDLARLASEWLAADLALRDEGLAAYRRVRPLDNEELALQGVFEESADLLAGGHWVRWHFLDRRIFEDSTTVTRGLERAVKRVERLSASSPGATRAWYPRSN
jgi:homoserine kinase type II